MNVLDKDFEECTNRLLDDDLSDISGAEDEFIVQDENTDSEQDDSETNELDVIPGTQVGNSDVEMEESDHSSSGVDEDPQPQYYYGKQQGKNRVRFKWSSKEPTRRGRPLAHNLIIPQLRGNVKALGVEATPFDIWKTIFTPEITTQILEHTNTKLQEIRPNYADQTRPELKNVEFPEMQAVIGLLYYGAIFKSNTEDLRSLYATDGTGREIFRLVMSHKRLEIILYCLRFDDRTTRSERKQSDPAAPISKLFGEIVANFKHNFHVAAYTCVDEMLCNFRGRCKFRVYMPNKPAKYGLKLMILTDARNSYCYNAYIYTGKGSDGEGLGEEYKSCSIPTKAVVRLTECIFNTNRNVTADNWFSSIPLSELLLKKGLTYLGTLKKNKPEIPASFQPNATKKVGSALFGFTKDLTLVSFVPKEKKAVLLVSSMHHNKSFDTETQKPTIITDYNMSKGGVDSLDKMCANYSTARKTHRWPMRLFYALLDITGVNCHVIYNSFRENQKFYNRGDFMKSLAKDLVTPHMQNRLAISSLQTELKMGMCRIMGVEMPRNKPPTNPAQPREKSKRKRCSTCPSAKDRKASTECYQCNNPICNECAKKFCKDCAP